jgi:hypothetical protein
MKFVEDRRVFGALLLVTFFKYFVVVGYLLLVLRRFGTLLTALPVVEGLALLIAGAAGCLFIIRGLDRWLASYEARQIVTRRPG